MTPEEIRADAIERIARAEYADWKRHHDALCIPELGEWPAPGYDEAAEDYEPKVAYRRAATRAVDALGGLLPAGEEWGIRAASGVQAVSRWGLPYFLGVAGGEPTICKRWVHGWRDAS